MTDRIIGKHNSATGKRVARQLKIYGSVNTFNSRVFSMLNVNKHNQSIACTTNR